MPANGPRVALDGSVRGLPPGSRDLGPAPAEERVEVTIRLRSGQPGRASPAIAAARAGLAQLSREQLREAAGADPDDLAAVAAFARESGLEVIASEAAERRVVVAGPVSAVSAAFGVELRRFEQGGTSWRGRTGPITLPQELGSIVQGVFGLDDRPQARPHFRVLGDDPADPAGPPAPSGVARPASTVTRSFSPPQVAQLYDFVPDADGSGQAIALIELGGGFREADLATWFARLGIPQPAVATVLVDGGRNEPSTPHSADGEVMLDIEVAGSVAPGVTIVVYFAPNTDRGFLDAITRAVHDTTHRPSVISISWGGPESAWTSQALTAMDGAFADAALLGVTVTCASGDNGSDDRVGDGRAHADFPASSPHVLACGGTRLEGTAGALSDEVSWNDGSVGGSTGGGVSDVFDLPAWQSGAGVPVSANPDRRVGRGLPDVAGDASPATGYAVRVDGRDMVFGGTSAVAPLYAGLVARLNQRLGRSVGFLNPALYGPAAGAIRDITVGDNGAYRAGPGWDACTGLGRIDGALLLAALSRT